MRWGRRSGGRRRAQPHPPPAPARGGCANAERAPGRLPISGRRRSLRHFMPRRRSSTSAWLDLVERAPRGTHVTPPLPARPLSRVAHALDASISLATNGPSTLTDCPAAGFYPTCSTLHASSHRRAHGAGRGTWLTLRRLGRCHPLGGHGFDPVPDRPLGGVDPMLNPDLRGDRLPPRGRVHDRPGPQPRPHDHPADVRRHARPLPADGEAGCAR